QFLSTLQAPKRKSAPSLDVFPNDSSPRSTGATLPSNRLSLGPTLLATDSLPQEPFAGASSFRWTLSRLPRSELPECCSVWRCNSGCLAVSHWEQVAPAAAQAEQVLSITGSGIRIACSDIQSASRS